MADTAAAAASVPNVAPVAPLPAEPPKQNQENKPPTSVPINPVSTPQQLVKEANKIKGELNARLKKITAKSGRNDQLDSPIRGAPSSYSTNESPTLEPRSLAYHTTNSSVSPTEKPLLRQTSAVRLELNRTQFSPPQPQQFNPAINQPGNPNRPPDLKQESTEYFDNQTQRFVQRPAQNNPRQYQPEKPRNPELNAQYSIESKRPIDTREIRRQDSSLDITPLESENRSRARDEAIKRAPQQIDNTRHIIETTGDKFLSRQQSSSNLQQRTQFVNPTEVLRNDSQNGMGLAQSQGKYVIDNSKDPNRLMKLARTEMSDNTTPIRPDSVASRPPIKTEPPRMPPIQPSFDLQPDSLQPDSLNSLKQVPPVMPSGKPVAKEMTITVSGKLPPQPQTPRGKSEEVTDLMRQPPQTQGNKAPYVGGKSDEHDVLRRTDSSFNMEGQRRQMYDDRQLSSSNLQRNAPLPERKPPEINRMDSSSNLNYRRPDVEFNKNGRQISEQRGVENENKDGWKNEDFITKRREMDALEKEKFLTSSGYLPETKNLNYSETPTSGLNKKYETDNMERPSDLNLFGDVSDKKVAGRVGWKNSEENKTSERKLSGRHTPTDKGVSFIDTPKGADSKVPGTWCALTGRFIPTQFDRPKSPDPRPKTPTTPKKKRSLGSYCPKTGRYIPPDKDSGAQTPRTPDGRKTPDFRFSNSGFSTPDVSRRGRISTREDFHVSFHEDELATPGRESGCATPSLGFWTPRVAKKPHMAFGSVVPDPPDFVQRRKVRRTKSNDWVERRYSRRTDGGHDSGLDDATQEHANAANGEAKSAVQTRRAPAASKIPSHKRASTPGGTGSPASSPLKSPNKPHPPRSASLTPEPSAERKKLPMNKIQVGTAASPNLKQIRSKIGSLENTTHKPGGGQIRIENRKIDFSTTGSRIAAKNDTYQPGGGEKKIQSQKLQWNAKSKIGSLENATHKAGGGDKKIDSQKLDFKEKAKPKIGSKDNLKHQPGGGQVKKTDPVKNTAEQSIETKKLDFAVTSKVGSLANVNHKPGGGEVKIFDDKEYIRQMSGGQTSSTGDHSKASSEGQASGTQSPVPCTSPGMTQPLTMSPTNSRS